MTTPYTLPDDPKTVADHQSIAEVRGLARSGDRLARIAIRDHDAKIAKRTAAARDKRTAERKRNSQTVAAVRARRRKEREDRAR